MAIARIGSAEPIPPLQAAPRWSPLRALGASLARHRALLLGCLLLPPLAAAAASLSIAPMHRAETTVRLTGPAAAAAQGEAALMRSLAVAEAALAARPTPGLDPARLSARLRAEVLAGGGLVRLSLAHPDPARAAWLLEGVTAAWLEARARLSESADRTRWRAELAEVEARLAQGQAQLRTPDLGQEIAFAAERRQRLVARAAEVAEAREGAAGRLAAAEAALAAQPGRVVASVERSNAPTTEEPRATLQRLLQERERMRTQYQPGAPMLADMERQIAAARTALRAALGTAVETSRETRNPAVESLTERVIAARVELDALTRQERELLRQRGEAEARLAELMSAERPLREAERRRDALLARLAAAEEAAAPAAGQVGVAPRPVLQPGTEHPWPLWTGLGAGAGLLAAGGAAAWLHRRRRVWLHPAEAEQALALPVLARVPAEAWTSAPRAVASLAAQLLDNAAPGQSQLVQFLGEGADGRDRLARALAVELSRVHGRSVVLIDLEGDGRRHLAELGDPARPPIPSAEGIYAHATGVPRLWITYQPREAALVKSHGGEGGALETGVMHLADRLRLAFDVGIVIGGAEVEHYARRRLSMLVDGNILMVREGMTDRDRVSELSLAVQGAGGRFFGFVWAGKGA